MSSRNLGFYALMTTIGLTACNTGGDTTQIDLSTTGLESLQSGNYEGWLIYGDEKVSTGTFKSNGGALMTTDRAPGDADAFVVTVEPENDPDPGPSGIVVLEGSVSGNGADLALPADLSSASGGFILKTPTDDATNIEYAIELSIDGLEDLTAGVYEGWLIFGEEKVSTGTFRTGAAATLRTDRDPAGSDMFVLTIEPDNDTDPGPSGIVVLAGAFDGETAALSFGADFSEASGGYILRTPTDDATDPNNDEAGVWFLDASSGTPMAALDLPALPSGWAYEGWAVTQGMPLTTGRFTSAEGADLDSPYSDGGPPFPGEDFVMNLPATITPPVNLADGASLVVISVEPDLNGDDPTGPAPFAIKPLAAMIPAGLGGGMFTAMGAGPVVTISGTATFSSVAVDNDSAGLWFLQIGIAGPEVGLTLPALPTGWVYEGWAVTQGTPLSSGRFTSAEGADQASPYSDGGPPFPGEDFLTDLPSSITGPVDLADGSSMVVISVEPDLDGVDPTGDGPFALKPLAAAVPAGLGGGIYTALGAGPVTTITGRVDFGAAE